MGRAVPVCRPPKPGYAASTRPAHEDVIVSANGQSARRLSNLTDQLEAVGVGRAIEFSVKRNDRPMTVRVKVEDIGRSS